MSRVERTSRSTHCLCKGECSHYGIPSGSDRSVNAIRSYAAFHPAVAAIKDCMAFHPNRVDAISET